jgi:hypothetical protein
MAKSKWGKILQLISRVAIAGFIIYKIYIEAGPWTALSIGLLFVYTEVESYYVFTINRRLRKLIDVFLNKFIYQD